MAKRLYSQIVSANPTLLSGSSDAELIELRDQIDEELRRRKEKAALDIRSMIANISTEYMKIDFGDHWTDPRTLSCVRSVERIDFQTVANAILTADGVNFRWELAVDFSKLLSRILFNAEGYAEPYVNGTEGHFCSRTASVVLNLWITLLKADTLPSDVGLRTKAARLHPYCLGRYGDLGFIGELLGGGC